MFELLLNKLPPEIANLQDIMNSIKKSTFLVYHNNCCLIGNNDFIYYLILSDTKQNNLRFLLDYSYLCRNKIIYTKNKSILKMCKIIKILPNGTIKARVK